MDRYLLALTQQFLHDPLHFFHEHEIHDVFFQLTREEFGRATTHEYDSIWRYHGRKHPHPFADRLNAGGKAANVDFVLLRRQFVTGYDYLTVMNKEEPLRANLRDVANGVHRSLAIDRAVEFKMAHCRPFGAGMQRGVGKGGFNALRKEMLWDCRKLANEGPCVAYLTAFMHPVVGGWFHPECFGLLANECSAEWTQITTAVWGPEVQGDLRIVLVVAHEGCYHQGNWEVDFPPVLQG
jgi:hypothetical protein